MKPTDETGKRYGRLTVVRRYGSDKGNATIAVLALALEVLA